MSIEFENDSVDVGVQKIEYYIDKDSSLKFLAPYIASSNFNGTIPIVDTMLTASFLKPGMTIAFNGGGVGDQYFPIVSIEFDDLDLTDSPTNLITIKYLDADSIVTSKEIDKSESVAVRYEDWDDKDLGSLGWSITSGGNAIFTNVGVRGEIEATTLDVGGIDGITYDGNTVTIGASVIINAPLTVGASGNFIVSGSAAQDIISNNTTITGGNIATGRIKSTGYSGPGTGSAFSTAGMSINLDDGSIAAPNFKIDSDGNAHFKGTVQSASGNLAGFILSASQISIAGFTMSTASGIYLGSNQEFKVDIQGNLVATSASISGDIRAKSGTFSGSVIATQIYGASVTGGVITGQQIVGGTIIGASGTFTGDLTATNLTASVGNIGGFNITKDSLNANNFAISTSGGLALGSASQFYVDTSGNLIANSASLTGNITANSGRFLGPVGVNGAGLIYAGNDPETGQRVILTSSGLFGFDSGNINIFSLPITGSPTIAGFTLVNTGLTGSGQMANMIFGNRGDNAYNITVRGDKTGGQAAAIYTVINGTPTLSNANNGFYLDDTGRMRLAGNNGSLNFDGTNLVVSGGINATSGSFAGWVRSASIVGGLVTGQQITGGTITGAYVTAGTLTGSTFRSSTGINASSGTGVYLDGDGNVRFSNSNATLTFDSSGLTISGTSINVLGYATDGELSSGLNGKIGNGGAAADIITYQTTIAGGNISTGNIKSGGYSGPGTGSAFSSLGMLINLDHGSLAAPNFRIDKDGFSFFKGQVTSTGLIIEGVSASIGYTRYSSGTQASVTDTYSILSSDGKDIFLKAAAGDPAKIRWLDSFSRQRATLGWEVSDDEGGEGTAYPNTLVIRANAVDASPTDTPGQILIHAQGAGSNINLKTGTNGAVTINGEAIETPGTIANRYKNGTDSPGSGNTIKYGTSTTLPTGAAQGDIYLRYV